MAGQRRIVRFQQGGSVPLEVLTGRAVEGCWFEVRRQGGYGAGEVRLNDAFADRAGVAVGDWLAIEDQAENRAYLGEVVARKSRLPGIVVLQLRGLGGALDRVFPGGFSASGADGVAPHRFGAGDPFPFDPDHHLETVSSVATASALVRELVQTYVVPATHIEYDASLIEAEPAGVGAVLSAKFRGEESVASILQDLACRAGNASWGVDDQRRLFFWQPRSTLLATLREGDEILALEEIAADERLFNRVLLTGDYVYGDECVPGEGCRGFWRWRGTYVDSGSRAEYGDRPFRLVVPWIRTPDDAESLCREFLKLYGIRRRRYVVQVVTDNLWKPWEGMIRLEDEQGAEIVTGRIESMRVEWDHVPVVTLELGPADPRQIWPEPATPERWELAAADTVPGYGGALLTIERDEENEGTVIMPSVTEGSTLWFGGGANYPAGTYQISYVEGAMIYGPPASGYQWCVHYMLSIDVGFYVVHDDGSTTIVGPGNETPYATQAECEAGNSGALVTFTHTGGKIGMYLYDTYYLDNVAGSPSPTFELSAV